VSETTLIKKTLKGSRNAAKNRALRDIKKIKKMLQRLPSDALTWNEMQDYAETMQELRSTAEDLMQRVHELNAYNNSLETVVTKRDTGPLHRMF